MTPGLHLVAVHVTHVVGAGSRILVEHKVRHVDGGHLAHRHMPLLNPACAVQLFERVKAFPARNLSQLLQVLLFSDAEARLHALADSLLFGQRAR